MSDRNTIFLFIIFGLTYSMCDAITYGSYTTPSRQAAPTLLNGDSMVGFTFFYQGFTLDSAVVSASWDCCQAVGGTINMNGGSLSMSQNLFLTGSATIASGGSINGNGYIITLPNSPDQFDLVGSFTFIDVTVALQTATSFNGSYNVSGTCVVEGYGQELDLSAASIVLNPSSNLYLKDLIISGIGSNTIGCTDNTGTITIDNVTWIQSGNYNFLYGSLSIQEQMCVKGNHAFVYASSGQSTINSNSTWYFDSGMTFSYDTAQRDRIIMTDNSSLLHLYETTLYSSVPGVRFTKGTLVIEGRCPVINNAASSNDGIQLGDNTSSANNVTYAPEADSGFDIQNGYVVYQNV